MNIKDGASTFEVVYHKATFKGMIMPFSGSFDSDGYPIDGSTNIVRKDWHICDGTNGTPDLRGRFILGASGSHAVGSTGGEENHTLTVEELPKVSGSIGTYIIWGDGRNESGVLHNNVGGTKFPSVATENAYSSNISISFGNDQPHNNMPPYYALSYIMKV